MAESVQSGLGSTTFLPFGSAPGAGVSPQGFDFGQFAQQLAGQAAQALPGLIMGLLAAHPTIGPQVRAQGVSPQSLFNLGVQTPFGGGGVSMFGAGPQAGQQAGVSPQGFDFGQFAQQIAQQAAQTLPGLIMSVLSAQPAFRQSASASTAIH